MVAAISVGVYPFFAFSDLTCYLEGTRIGVLVALCCLIVKRLSLEVARKRSLHHQVKIPR